MGDVVALIVDNMPPTHLDLRQLKEWRVVANEWRLVREAEAEAARVLKYRGPVLGERPALEKVIIATRRPWRNAPIRLAPTGCGAG